MRFPHGRLRRAAVLAAAMVAAAATTGLVPGTADAAVSCEVTYATTQWGEDGGGFTASVNVANTGDHIAGWTLTFTFPGSQRLTYGWSAQWAQTGHLVAASVPAGSISPGASAAVGFAGTWRGSNPRPTDFAVNGVPCVAGPSPSPAPTPVPSPSPSATPSVVVSPAEIVVPEGGSALIHVRLSQKPSYGWVTVDSERLLGDPDLSIGPRLLFPADQWSTWQSLTVFAAEDDDAADGTAAFLSRISQLPGSGVALWTARELDNDVATPSPAPSPS
ncbi:cellulose binding domain-containing protein [Microbispora sp. NPDC049633]|uniref:cellulose binding domain-containing protein n=1 Tax=Microbispora sp. NPDC049633 TaxID=3154355 RepID=UPI0034160915